MKRILLPLGLASLAITLALVAGARLPGGWLPVVLGVIAGVAASLPTSLFIVWRVTKGARRPPPRPAPRERPPTIIVVPPTAPAAEAQAAAPRPEPAPKRTAPAYMLIGGRDEV